MSAFSGFSPKSKNKIAIIRPKKVRSEVKPYPDGTNKLKVKKWEISVFEISIGEKGKKLARWGINFVYLQRRDILVYTV